MTNMMLVRAGLVAGALSVALASTASTTSAQQPPIVIGGGLVNVQIIDVIDDVVIRDINVNVNAAVRIAANVCGVAVGVIAEDLQDGNAQCDVANGPGDIVVINQ